MSYTVNKLMNVILMNHNNEENKNKDFYTAQLRQYDVWKKKKIEKSKNEMDRYVEDWKKEVKNRKSVLSEENIDFLGKLAIINLQNLNNKQGLTEQQRSMKRNIHNTLTSAFSDIDRMIFFGLIGIDSRWNPISYEVYKPVMDGQVPRKLENRPVYKFSSWEEAFPISRVSRFIECLVSMYGDSYAIPIAGAVEFGLKKHDNNADFTIEVPIIRKSVTKPSRNAVFDPFAVEAVEVPPPWKEDIRG